MKKPYVAIVDDYSAFANDLRTFVRTRFNVDPSDAAFDDDVHLFDYGYVDSFGAVELTVYSERKYGIRVTNDDLVMNPLNTINEISAFIHRRLADRA